MKEYLERIVKGMIKPTVLVGKVVAFDDQTWTVSVQLNSNDLTFEDVKIKSIIDIDGSTGIHIKPTNNSYVLIGIVENNMNSAFVIKYSKIDQFKIVCSDTQLNGDTFGGIVKIDDLKTQYDANFNAFKSACVAAFTALSALDASASLNAFNAASISILALNKTTLENTNVKHG